RRALAPCDGEGASPEERREGRAAREEEAARVRLRAVLARRVGGDAGGVEAQEDRRGERPRARFPREDEQEDARRRVARAHAAHREAAEDQPALGEAVVGGRE